MLETGESCDVMLIEKCRYAGMKVGMSVADVEEFVVMMKFLLWECREGILLLELLNVTIRNGSIT